MRFCFVFLFCCCFYLSSSCDIGESSMDPAPLLFLGSQPLAILLVSVYLTLLFHLIAIPLSSLCVFFHCASHLLSLPLYSCLGCILLLIGLPFLRSLLTRMFFLPYAFIMYVFVFCMFLLFSLLFVFLFLFAYLFLFLVSFVSLPGNDVICWLLSCPFPSVWFLCFFSPNASLV